MINEIPIDFLGYNYDLITNDNSVWKVQDNDQTNTLSCQQLGLSIELYKQNVNQFGFLRCPDYTNILVRGIAINDKWFYIIGYIKNDNWTENNILVATDNYLQHQMDKQFKKLSIRAVCKKYQLENKLNILINLNEESKTCWNEASIITLKNPVFNAWIKSGFTLQEIKLIVENYTEID